MAATVFFFVYCKRRNLANDIGGAKSTIGILFLMLQVPVGQGLVFHEVSRRTTVGRTPLDE